MADLNKDRIFNESSKKVLLREFENLKKDYNKMNVLKYKSLYENESLSFILDNSRYIFSEPMKGLEFYERVINNSCIPFNRMEDEYHKLESYVAENQNKMSHVQAADYEVVLEEVASKYNSMKNTINLYDNMMENVDSMDEYYNAMYEYMNDINLDARDKVLSLMQEKELNLIDTINLVSFLEDYSAEDYSADLFHYIESAYVENPTTPEEYQLNTYTSNVLSRIMKDIHFQEAVNQIQNVNLRHLIQGISGVRDGDVLESVGVEVIENYNPMYSSAVNSVNKLFDDIEYAQIYEESNDEEKLNNLLCEKAVVDMNLSFLILDTFSESEEDLTNISSVVEKLCVESTEIEAIPTSYDKQISMLEAESLRLEKEIELISEKYFSSSGGPSSVVAKSIGLSGDDDKSTKKDDKKEEEVKTYTPQRMLPEEPKEDETHDDNADGDKVDDDEDGKDLTEEEKKKKEAKDRQTEKYANMEFDDEEFNKLTTEADDINTEEVKEESIISLESAELNVLRNKRNSTYAKYKKYLRKCDELQGDINMAKTKAERDKFMKMQDNIQSKIKSAWEEHQAANEAYLKLKKEVKESTYENLLYEAEEYTKVEKPQKKNVFQRIQNKALDANVQFKKKVAEAKRKAVDARNAKKAVAKVPTNIIDSIKKRMDEWDEMDDNRRKEYIIKPGFRKKYFKALKLCILHYGAFAINPVLNVVLLICHNFSNTKDVRIRNELTRELKAEIKVTEEKIEDAKANGDNKQKYQLMRIKEKLEAELVRVGANSSYI